MLRHDDAVGSPASYASLFLDAGLDVDAWETTYLEASRDFIFRNTFADIEGIIERLGKGHGTKFEFECYDVGHLYTLAHFLDRKLVQPPLFVQTIFGYWAGREPTLKICFMQNE